MTITTWYSVGRLAALASICALGWTQAPALKPIPGGEFQMGSDKGTSWERPVHAVSVPAFEIGARPVSNAEFRAFRPGHTSSASNVDDAPVTGVSFLDAEEYCAWLSERLGKKVGLPTEARWERAVRGGREQLDYPWGSAPAGSQQPANGYGIYAVAANLWEWTADWYADDYYAQSAPRDPPGPESGTHRVLRGGGFAGQPDTATCYSRGSARPETRSPRITFRVAVLEGAQEPRQLTEVRPKPEPAPEPPPPEPTPRPRPRAAPKPTPQPAPAPPQPSSAGYVEVSKIDVIDDGAGLAIVLTSPSSPTIKGFGLDNPPRLALDIDNCRLRFSPLVGEIAVGRRGVAKLRYAQRTLDPPSVRLVADLEGAVDYSVEPAAGRTLIKLTPR